MMDTWIRKPPGPAGFADQGAAWCVCRITSIISQDHGQLYFDSLDFPLHDGVRSRAGMYGSRAFVVELLDQPWCRNLFPVEALATGIRLTGFSNLDLAKVDHHVAFIRYGAISSLAIDQVMAIITHWKDGA